MPACLLFFYFEKFALKLSTEAFKISNKMVFMPSLSNYVRLYAGSWTDVQLRIRAHSANLTTVNDTERMSGQLSAGNIYRLA